MKSKKLKTASILLSIILNANISYSQNQNNITNGCPGGPCVRAIAGNWAYINKDTIMLPVSGVLTLGTSYFSCCSPKIVDWYRNDTLIASGTSTYNCPNEVCTSLSITKPGVYTTYFQGYYYGPGFANSCAVFVLPFHSAAGPTGINENENLNNAIIYPSPTDNYLFIENIKEIKTVSISDINGNSVPFNMNKQGNKLKIDFDLPSGIYFVKTQFGDGINTKKFVVYK